MNGFTIILVFAFFVTSPCVFGDSTTYVSVKYPPFISDEKVDNVGNGVFTDIVMATFKTANIEAKQVLQPLKRTVMSFSRKKYTLT